MQVSYWEEVVTPQPNMSKLDAASVQMYNSFNEANKCFEKLLRMNPYSVETLRLYARFLLQVRIRIRMPRVFVFVSVARELASRVCVCAGRGKHGMCCRCKRCIVRTQVVNDMPKGMALLKQAEEVESALSQRQSDDSSSLVFFSKV